MPIPFAKDPLGTEDPHQVAAAERGKAAVSKLQGQGIIDKDGRRIQTDLPSDMQAGKNRDFGG